VSNRNSAITWTNERRKLRDLVPWDHNPREINKREAERLGDSLAEFGQIQTIAIGPDNEVYDGHQRKLVWTVLPSYGPDFEVDVRVASRPLTDKERQKLVIYLHKGTVGQWDFDELANSFELPDLLDWGFEERELLGDWGKDLETQHKITRSGRLYNAGEGHDIEPFKLAYRIEAAWRARGGIALDLFSGNGQLAAWYKRRFDRVVTVDREFQVGDVDYSMSASAFLENHLCEWLDFDLVDFDDEGSPADEIRLLFDLISNRKTDPFILCLTDGSAMNLKFHGKFQPARYLLDGEVRQATREDYDTFGDTITTFIETCSRDSGFSAELMSSYRGRSGNVLYQTWSIDRLPNHA